MLDRQPAGITCLMAKHVQFVGRPAASIRNRKVVLYFSKLQITPRQTALANVILPMPTPAHRNESREKAHAALKWWGWENVFTINPMNFRRAAAAGCQRPAIDLQSGHHSCRRAAGALDSKSGRKNMDQRLSMNRERGTT